MTEVIEFVDWKDDFRYAEERRRVAEIIRSTAAEQGGFSHAIVQEMFIKNRYRTMVGLHLTVHLKKREWVDDKTDRYVPVRIYFTEDATLDTSRNYNPDWYPEVIKEAAMSEAHAPVATTKTPHQG